MLDRVPLQLVQKMIQTKGINISVQGQSMEPLMVEGDVIHIGPAKNVKAGDIALLYDGERYIIHRIIYMDDEIIFSKGDNNRHMDCLNLNMRLIGKAEIDSPCIVPIKNKQQMKFVFWKKEDYEACRDVGDRLRASMVHATQLFEDGINIAVLPTSMKMLYDNEKMFHEICAINEKIYVHINVPISDYPQKGFVLDTEFRFVFRSGSLKMNHKLSSMEKFIALLGEINMLCEGL